MSNDRSKLWMPLTIGVGATAAAAYTAYSFFSVSDTSTDLSIDINPQPEADRKLGQDISTTITSLNDEDTGSISISPISVPSVSSSTTSSPSKSTVQAKNNVDITDLPFKSSFGLSWLFNK